MGRIQDYPIDGTPENGDILLGTNILDAKKSKNYSIQSIVGLVPAGPTGAQGVQGQIGLQGPIGPVSPAGLTWMGSWNTDSSYILNDTIGFNGASWFCISPVSTTGNTNPSIDTTRWALLASQGAAGATGAVGAQGPQGIQGIPGISPSLPYLSYASIISQAGTSAPTESIIYNNTGATAVWTRTAIGDYQLTFSSNVFVNPLKIWYSNSNNQGFTRNSIDLLGTNSITFKNYNSLNALVDVFTKAPIEIRIYS